MGQAPSALVQDKNKKTISPWTPYAKTVGLPRVACQQGHLGTERVLDLVRSWFYWPQMQSNIDVEVLMYSPEATNDH